MSKDLFSKQSVEYAKYRPVYPSELIEYIVSFVKEKNRCWDCACGNGQASALLAKHFNKIIATDISEQQLQQAIPHEKIEYLPMPAEKTSIPGNHFDLITVAQAYHWFQFDEFYKEATRVAKPDGMIAVWGYGLLKCIDETVNNLIVDYYKNKVGPYWDKERKYVDEGYKTVPFGFEELPARQFKIAVEWSKDDLLGYLNTWSALQHFVKANNYNPVEAFAIKLNEVWPGDALKHFHFPVFLRMGRVKK